MKKYNKKRLFEIISKLDESFKPKLNEEYSEATIGDSQNLVYLRMPDNRGFFWADHASRSKESDSYFVLNTQTMEAVPVVDKIKYGINDADITYMPVIDGIMRTGNGYNVSQDSLANLGKPIKLRLDGNKYTVVVKGALASTGNVSTQQSTGNSTQKFSDFYNTLSDSEKNEFKNWAKSNLF